MAKMYTRTFMQVIEDNLDYKVPNLVYQEFLDRHEYLNIVLADDPRASPGRSSPDSSLPETDMGPTSFTINRDERLYVYPCFMKPGKHYFVVRSDPPATGGSSMPASIGKRGRSGLNSLSNPSRLQDG